MDIQHSNRAAVNNIRYENIRVEVDDFNPLPVLQKQRDDKYQPNPPAGGYVPELFVIVIAHNKYSFDPERGTVRDVNFKDISVTGKPTMPSSFTGFDAQHDVRAVTIENLRFNGRRITNADDAHLKIGKYVQDVRLLPSGGEH